MKSGVVFVARWFRRRKAQTYPAATFSATNPLETTANWRDAFAPQSHVAPAYAGQTFADLERLLDRHAGQGELTLNFHTLNDGYFWIGPGQDGVLLDSLGHPVEQSARLRNHRLPIPDLGALRAQAVRLDFDVFVGVDHAWGNYYHWLCLALPKMLMARHVGCPPFRIATPDLRRPKSKVWSAGISERTWEQSLVLSGLSDEIVRLPPGIYTAPRVHSIFIDSQEKALLPCVAKYDRLYDPIRQKLRVNPASPPRILIQRRDTQRLQGSEISIVETHARNRGFIPVHLEDLDFLGQAELFHNAQAVIAPHGAALSNLVFGKPSLRILEINRFLPEEQHLRPWFYLLARARGQSYSFLNISQGDLAEERFRSALDALCARSGPASKPDIWWDLQE